MDERESSTSVVHFDSGLRASVFEMSGELDADGASVVGSSSNSDLRAVGLSSLALSVGVVAGSRLEVALTAFIDSQSPICFYGVFDDAALSGEALRVSRRVHSVVELLSLLSQALALASTKCSLHIAPPSARFLVTLSGADSPTVALRLSRASLLHSLNGYPLISLDPQLVVVVVSSLDRHALASSGRPELDKAYSSFLAKLDALFRSHRVAWSLTSRAHFDAQCASWSGALVSSLRLRRCDVRDEAFVIDVADILDSSEGARLRHAALALQIDESAALDATVDALQRFGSSVKRLLPALSLASSSPLVHASSSLLAPARSAAPSQPPRSASPPASASPAHLLPPSASPSLPFDPAILAGILGRALASNPKQ